MHNDINIHALCIFRKSTRKSAKDSAEKSEGKPTMKSAQKQIRRPTAKIKPIRRPQEIENPGPKTQGLVLTQQLSARMRGDPRKAYARS
ncbi:hypothetical protein HMPREF0620_1146 [Parascardovia denticolens DSM 10105 = JCM 12538]|uniref:Uncharacterized protein n=1 Tax=Parascardovia denticolens DSM 10105 = JCM 12538 TaxID=864564 RepID=E6K029_PARDN|nr:hypothetical protein HMPREF0620_1146 [Parascardovia denticolens DSM 10105 = JCM 12538]